MAQARGVSFQVATFIIRGLNTSGGIYMCVTKLFYKLFYYLEELGLLDHNNDVHIYALYYIFIPRVNHALHGCT